MLKEKILYYRDFRLNRLHTPAYSHIKLLLFWPIFGLVFTFLEKGLPWLCAYFGIELIYHPIYCPLDEEIVFNELFVIPYYFWFAYIVLMLIYLFFFEIPVFRKYMWFFIFTYGASGLIYFLFPNMQNFRPLSPEMIGRDNILIDIAFLLYSYDTNTNVFPSMHVIGSFAVCFAAWHSKLFGKWPWRIAFFVVSAIISVSTVYLRQHSVLDILGGLAISAIAYPFIFLRKPKKRICRKRSEIQSIEKLL